MLRFFGYNSKIYRTISAEKKEMLMKRMRVFTYHNNRFAIVHDCQLDEVLRMKVFEWLHVRDNHHVCSLARYPHEKRADVLNNQDFLSLLHNDLD